MKGRLSSKPEAHVLVDVGPKLRTYATKVNNIQRTVEDLRDEIDNLRSEFMGICARIEQRIDCMDTDTKTLD